MAQRVVIAEIAIDENGAVAPVQKTGAAIAGLEKQTRSTSDVFTARMFSMRTAAMAFLGSFTLAGAIYGLKNFAESVFKASAAFPEFSRSMTAVHSSVLALIGEITQANQVLSDLSIILRSIRNVSELVRTRGGSTAGVVWQLLFGQTPLGEVQRMLGMTAAILKATGAAAETARERTGGAQFGILELDVPAMAGLIKKRPYSAARLSEGTEWMQPMREWATDLQQPIEEIALGFESISDSLSRIGEFDVGPRVFDAYTESLTDLAIALEQTSLRFNVIMTASQAFGDAMAEAAVSGSLNAKKFLGTIIQAVGQAIIAYGVLLIAQGFTSYNYAQVAKGLGLISAGAATIAIGSRMAGSGAGSESGASYGRAGGGVAQQGGPSYNITFITEGNIIGNEDWARQQALWMKKALADGAAGGSF